MMIGIKPLMLNFSKCEKSNSCIVKDKMISSANTTSHFFLIGLESFTVIPAFDFVLKIQAFFHYTKCMACDNWPECYFINLSEIVRLVRMNLSTVQDWKINYKLKFNKGLLHFLWND